MKKSIFLSFLLICLPLAATFAQALDDLGVVWSKTYGIGCINNIKPNRTGGGYVAAGYPWNSSTPKGLSTAQGLVIEIDESGNELRRGIARIPQTYLTNHTNTAALDAQFVVAFKTSDNGILAFGILRDKNAPNGEREYDYETNQPNQSADLITGIWVVKFDRNMNVVTNRLDQGRLVRDGWETEIAGNFVIAGYDSRTSQNNSSTNTTMLRVYNSSGTWTHDFRQNYGDVTSLYKLPNENKYLATTGNSVLEIGGTGNTLSTCTQHIITGLTGMANPYVFSVSPATSGSFITAMLDQNSANGGYTGGNSLYKLNSSYNSQVWYNQVKPSTRLFYSPLLLKNTMPKKYVGAAHYIKTVANPPVYEGAADIYELTENSTSNYTVKYVAAGRPVAEQRYPNGTALKLAGQEDGFFSTGQGKKDGTGENGHAAIAKLSTCAQFYLTIPSTDLSIPVSSGTTTATVPSQTISWGGQTGTVTGTWTITDITPGGTAVTFSGSTGSLTSASKTIPSKTFTLNSGKTFALVRYSITIADKDPPTPVSRPKI